eukprot:15462626-Alexandrium_andersonii.AAC.1
MHSQWPGAFNGRTSLSFGEPRRAPESRPEARRPAESPGEPRRAKSDFNQGPKRVSSADPVSRKSLHPCLFSSLRG